MNPNLPNILTFLFLFFGNLTTAQEIWIESFAVPEKGVWGDENGSTVHQDFENITNWSLEFSDVRLSSPDDYAKTTSTSGGRFECRDINGEVIWRSIEISISGFKSVDIELLASETGSGANEQNKYLKAFYKIDNGEEILFSENYGNWGSSTVKQKELNGQKLQIVVYLNNHYAADKVILDEVVVSAEVVYESIYPGDVLISEVLFNPFPDGNDYVEIYNNSEKQIATNQLYLASRNKNSELDQIYQLSNKYNLFQPNTYLALSKDTNGVFPFFTIKCTDCFLQMKKFPSFNNDEDFVVLLNNEMQIIDEFYYTDKLHAPLLADKEGISLERNSFSIETNNLENWHSASTESGYGTPGYENSQIQNENIIEPLVTFSPESFSPNSDGYNDEYQINIQLEKPGYIANILIFDAAGRLVTRLAENEILGTSGNIKWNGEDKTGQRQNLGVYVVVVEIFDMQGNIHRYKDGVVLTNILE
jgi:hypothetical protein